MTKIGLSLGILKKKKIFFSVQQSEHMLPQARTHTTTKLARTHAFARNVWNNALSPSYRTFSVTILARPPVVPSCWYTVHMMLLD
jgi:hypothetical protein